MGDRPATRGVLAAWLVAAACTTGGASRPAAAPPATVSPSKSGGLCRPFPDRLIDELLAAYNGRDLDALREVVVAPRVRDLVAAAYAGGASFEDVEEWARASWEAGDRMHSVGYGAFHPGKDGFQMFLTRGSDRLRGVGIESVATTLDARTDGCTVTSLKSSGPVQAIGDPCAFYDRYEALPDVAAAEPRACADGSAQFARSDPVVATDGGRVMVWGGSRGGLFRFGDVAMDGFVLDAGSGRATAIRAGDLPGFRPDAGAWTGAELIVAGSRTRPDYRVVAASYDPAARSWRSIDFPYDGWTGFGGVWTGSELVLWGGPDHSARPYRRGAIYEPASGSWRRTSRAPIGGRWSHAAVWTGREMVVWGGSDSDSDLGDGAAYDPATDTWRRLAPALLSPRQWMPTAWTGTEVVVWGGSSFSRNRADGAAYDPASDSWRKLPPAPIEGRHHHSATWTGEELIVFGGYDYRRPFADGAAYDPATDRWRKLPRGPLGPRFGHGAAWTGETLFVFGGTGDPGHIALGDGALYDPRSDRWRRFVP